VAPGERLRTAGRSQGDWDTPMMGLTGTQQAVSDWWRGLMPSLGLGKPEGR
jgi:hypothetical protein